MGRPTDHPQILFVQRTIIWEPGHRPLIAHTRTLPGAPPPNMQGRDTQIMALSVQFVGIDVSKAWLDVWFEGTKRDERFSNEEAGWTALLVRLTAAGETAGVRIALEASGGYERGLREALLAAGVEVYLLNPLRVR